MGLKSTVCFILIIYVMGFRPSAAQDVQMKSGIFTIPPWGMRDAGGPIHGITIDMLEKIGEHSGILFEHKYLPFKRMVGYLEAGIVDISAFYRDKKIPQDAVVPIAYLHSDDVIVIGRQGTGFEKFEDLQGLLIALPNGANYLRQFNEDRTISKTFTRGHDQSVEMLLKNRVDAIAGSGRAIESEFRKRGMTLAELGSPYFLARHEVWVHVSSKTVNRGLRDRVTIAVNNLRTEGVFEEILSKYY